MNKHLLLVCLVLVSVLSLAQAPTNGLVAYYPFNYPNATDASGNNRNGTFSGVVTGTTDRFGNPNQAYNFDGSTGKITVTNWQILTGNAARTMSAWFKSTIPAGYTMMVSWGSINSNLSSSLGTGVDPIQLAFYSVNVGYSVGIANPQYYDERWHLVTSTHDGSTMKFYVDGTLLATTSNVTLNTSSSNLVIGSYSPAGGYFKGALDEVRVYNRALTDTEIQQMYTAEAPPPPSAEFAKLGSNRFIHTIGQFNTSVGNMAGNAITTGTGTRNTFMGFQTGRDNTTGSYNTFMGYQAGYLITTGVNNVFLGANANPVGANAAVIQNSAAIGANAKVAISDAIVLGDTLNTNIKVGIGTAAPRYPLDVKGNVNIRKNGAVPGRLIFAGRSSITTDEQDYLVFSGGQKGESGIRLTNLSIESPAEGVASRFLSVDASGRVGIYDAALPASMVRIKVANPTDWADYVFNADYPLPSLQQLGNYVKQHNHLPNIPSAETMATDGASVEELIKGLVKNQEEQARYLLQLQEENRQLRELVEALLKNKK